MKHLLSASIALIFFFTLSAQADTASRDQLLRFVKAIGIYEQLDEQKIALKSHGGKAAKQYAEQIKASIPELPEQFSIDLESEMAVYMSNISNLIDTDFAVNTYIDLISKKLTSSEVQQLIEFHESDLGRKYTRSNTEITGEWTTQFMGDMDKKLMINLQAFADNLMAKVSSYNQEQ
ncbi:MAG: hypothetical protein GY820_07255 [Gammaproteobacteria bacterium]|nr:hypothetical protein [Gammaproteobacteria bacterium]